ncbi:aldo-keto reductase family 1 member A1-A [Diachasma alloeum]|uniref:aldo-keto reductase family 1 member A1-A n=1 Tax=Diachasma alloeum TaxID=454923 RepID=UPI0007383E10|nr:aldo-keto reductase family 1 member A1-A [Diachasma alloeum]
MSAQAVPKIEISNGHFMPMFGLGTYLSVAGEVERAVKYAIDIGYRHIDTAFYYKNEKEVGDAIREKIKDGTVKREDLFVTTKLWNTAHAEDKVLPTCKKSLENLGLDYMDLYLIHWPVAFQESEELMPRDSNDCLMFSDTDYLETWRGMEECVRQGLARSIGLSNFNSQQIARIMEVATIKPVNNQVEVTVNLNQVPLIEFCKKHGITVTGYSPLGRPGNRRGVANSLDSPQILAIAAKYKKTPAQIACRYVYQQGAAPIPKSVTESRIKENIDIFDFELTSEEMKTIESAGSGERMGSFPEAKDHQYYPFSIPF